MSNTCSCNKNHQQIVEKSSWHFGFRQRTENKYKIEEKNGQKNQLLFVVFDWVTQWLNSIKTSRSQMHHKLYLCTDWKGATNYLH